MFVIAASSRRSSSLGLRVKALFVNPKNAEQNQDATSLPCWFFA
jgi:hypothetical protein